MVLMIPMVVLSVPGWPRAMIQSLQVGQISVVPSLIVT